MPREGTSFESHDEDIAGRAGVDVASVRLVGWREARQLHPAEQRTWMLEQIRSLSTRAGRELAERGTYADGLTKGPVDAYLRAARAFGLVTDAEIIQLIPARFLERPS